MLILFLFIVLTLLYIFHPHLNLLAIKKVLGITLFVELFYLIGHYMSGWPFPTPAVILQLLIVVATGVATGVVFSRVWPLPDKKGFERIARTLLIMVPALGLGIGMQLLLQGQYATQALYLIFALSTWLGSGHFIRKTVQS
ncbi:hypothetical protein SAMN05421676_11388 [Salinibacillus kushneri]|uniref:Uncharacterized protein n=1 Tax=Salinibacillus kushneri TaxID=237682 RepID=A0A1I0ISY6_9BACI|nr:hypothetical protein [Salinibacillus kushneri]SET99642.1 hypothetical protein SAMN05421676_11388 [Salinibacillus kushneri]